MASLTAANSVLMLSVLSLFPIPQQIQGFAADDVAAAEPVEPVEVSVGVDGKMSAGWVPTAKPWTITLQADSASNLFFEAWATAQEALKDVYFANGTAIVKSISRSYVMVNGVLSQYPPMAGIRRTLQPRQYRITWESITPVPV